MRKIMIQPAMIAGAPVETINKDFQNQFKSLLLEVSSTISNSIFSVIKMEDKASA
jgi:hypothetical protein